MSWCVFWAWTRVSQLPQSTGLELLAEFRYLNSATRVSLTNSSKFRHLNSTSRVGACPERELEFHSLLEAPDSNYSRNFDVQLNSIARVSLTNSFLKFNSMCYFSLLVTCQLLQSKHCIWNLKRISLIKLNCKNFSNKFRYSNSTSWVDACSERELVFRSFPKVLVLNYSRNFDTQTQQHELL